MPQLDLNVLVESRTHLRRCSLEVSALKAILEGHLSTRISDGYRGRSKRRQSKRCIGLIAKRQLCCEFVLLEGAKIDGDTQLMTVCILVFHMFKYDKYTILSNE